MVTDGGKGEPEAVRHAYQHPPHLVEPAHIPALKRSRGNQGHPGYPESDSPSMGVAGEKVAGYAYFDTHRVRTLAETVMVVVNADGKVQKIDVLSFDEPPEYFPKRRWLDQILGRKLDDELSLSRAIRPMSGASLTGRAIVNASRKILALHHVLTR